MEDDSGLPKREILSEVERAADLGPVVHNEPLRIPSGLLAQTIPAAAVRPAAGRLAEWALYGLPTLIVLAFAVLWTTAACARHDVPAYGVGFALTVAALVAGWGRATRAL